MFQKEDVVIDLLEFLVGERSKLTFFIKSNPKLLTRFGGLTLSLIAFTVI